MGLIRVKTLSVDIIFLKYMNVNKCSYYLRIRPLTTPDCPIDSPTHDTTLNSATDSPTDK